ncbi:lipase-like PAD4 isoform X2 [Impatiens glandulifera]|uniref:lipase-like PAD4 isoform X2 n=1 Tax=Impatiens glandulifera TaxID=253017 RepID=UPI001FB1542C|nr:lipase-like PAD4 isoform X2 [Impatiens glandulifera]
MEADNSSFESSEMQAMFLASTPLLSESWKFCNHINTAAAAGSFVVSPAAAGEVVYVAFSGVQLDQTCLNLVPLDNTFTDDLFCALHRRDKPAMVHAGYLHLFLNLIRCPNFQNQIGEILKKSKSIVFTGHSIGGVLASLSALWFLSSLQTTKSNMSVLCVTFGSPFLGNETLSRAILEQRWGGNFCHVVAKQDINVLTTLISSQIHFSLWPFGGYMFCSRQGAIFLENATSVVKMIHLMVKTVDHNLDHDQDHLNYGDYIGKLSFQFLRREDRFIEEGKSSYETGIILALQSSEISNQELCFEEAKDCLRTARTLGRAPNMNMAKLSNKLAEITPLRAQIQWYKEICDKKGEKLGYYDTFKRRGDSKKEMKINMCRLRLGAFWDNVIKMVENNKLPYDIHKRGKYVMASLFYKLLVEPLDIAEYYRSGEHRVNGNYLQYGRERRYLILDKWWNDLNDGEIRKYERSTFASLTQDSCFWAKVEEAIKWVYCIRNESDKSKLYRLWENLNEFENYAMGMVVRKEVSIDVVQANSSYSLWLREWGELKSQFQPFQSHSTTAFELDVAN